MLWLFWGCSLTGAGVVTYFVLVDFCVLGPALLGGHHFLRMKVASWLSLKKIQSWCTARTTPGCQESSAVEAGVRGQAGDIRVQCLGW